MNKQAEPILSCASAGIIGFEATFGVFSVKGYNLAHNISAVRLTIDQIRMTEGVTYNALDERAWSAPAFLTQRFGILHDDVTIT